MQPVKKHQTTHPTALLSEMYRLLKQLSEARRRDALNHLFGGLEKRALEAWILDQKNKAPEVQIMAGEHTCQSALVALQTTCDTSDTDCDASDGFSANGHLLSSRSAELAALCDGASASTSSEMIEKLDGIEDREDLANRGTLERLAERETHTNAASGVTYDDRQLEVVKNDVHESGQAGTISQSPRLVGDPIKSRRDYAPNVGYGDCIQGLQQRTVLGVVWYQAVVYFRCLVIKSRSVVDLAIALDFLVVLTSIKQGLNCSDALKSEVHVKSIVLGVLRENQVTAEEMGLAFSVKLRLKWYWFPRQINSPSFHDLDLALNAWIQLSQFSSHTVSKVSVHEKLLRHRCFSEEWIHFREAYLDICKFGRFFKKGAQGAKSLDALFEAAQPLRERDAMDTEEHWQRRAELELQRRSAAVEHWNRHAMAVEERWQRRVAGESRRHERHERKALAAEDQLAKRQHRSLSEAEERSISKLRRLLIQWRRAVWREQHAKRSEQHASQRQFSKDARAKQRHRQDEQRRRWKHMSRRDITMNDLLGLHRGMAS